METFHLHVVVEAFVELGIEEAAPLLVLEGGVVVVVPVVQVRFVAALAGLVRDTSFAARIGGFFSFAGRLLEPILLHHLLCEN
jgi:hypothetical protein